ncbi:MAG: response regulator transcription factor [Coriobacteriales bacterium]
MKLLIAEDNERLLATLVKVLEREGYTVDGVDNGAKALDYLRSTEYDGLLLDIMMPEMDGLEVLKAARAEGFTCPVMLFSALTEVSQRVDGLDAGADDYLPKPFDMTELTARVRAMLRRRDSFSPQVMELAGMTLDCSSHKLEYKGAQAMLGGKEFQIMEMLMARPGAIVPVERILMQAWNWEKAVDTSVVWVQVSNLRKKITGIKAPVTLRFERGAGYILEEDHAQGA